MSKEQDVIIAGAPRNKNQKVSYQKRRKGIPLEKGMTFQDLSTAQRQSYFLGAESSWKKEYNRKRGTIGMTEQTISRG